MVLMDSIDLPPTTSIFSCPFRRRRHFTFNHRENENLSAINEKVVKK